MEVVLIDCEFSVKGVKKVIWQLVKWYGKKEVGEKLCSEIDWDLVCVQKFFVVLKVLFIYVWGVGILMVVGDYLQVLDIIEMVGGVNVVIGFEDFKLFIVEVVINVNLDVLLMFDFGVQSFFGENGVFKFLGVVLMKVGRNCVLIIMDGQFLIGFGLCVGKVVVGLNNRLLKIGN